MKKFLLSFFILLDLVVIAACSFYLFYAFTQPKRTVSPAKNSFTPRPASVPAPLFPPATPRPMVSTTRRILFTYHNARARKVLIRGDFTGWKGEPMQKTVHNTWTYTAALSPGEYAYCFTVDGKSIPDPANKKTKRIGKAVVSSKIIAAPAPSSSLH